MEIPKKIKDEIWDYCRVNDISNIDEFILKMISQGFTVEKYGAAPTAKERIVEKIVEKEIEKIIEVPVEKVIEKIVEKELLITNDEAFSELTNKISELESKLINLGSELNSECEEKLKEREDKITLLTNLLDIEKRKKRDIYGE
jgi:ParB family transcriptional regulator, chromosome partitioning protein